MKAYWIANYTEIKDDERLKKYAVKAKEAVEKYSGKILARSANNITLQGREMIRVALAEFPDIEAEVTHDSVFYVYALAYVEEVSNIISEVINPWFFWQFVNLFWVEKRRHRGGF